MEKLNHVDYSRWSLKDIVEYVTNDDSQVSFSSYARTYIEKIDKPITAKNYILALKHLEKYMGTCELMFQFKNWFDVGNIAVLYHIVKGIANICDFLTAKILIFLRFCK